MPESELISLLMRGGAIGILAIIVVALVNEWVYTRGRFNDMRADRDMWRRIALGERKVLRKADEVLPDVDEDS